LALGVLSLSLSFFATIPSEASSERGDNSDLLVADLLKKHQASRERIQTVICKVHLQRENTNTTDKVADSRDEFLGSFWITKNSVRAKWFESGRNFDGVWKNNTLTTQNKLSAGGKELWGATRIAVPSRHWLRGDPYRVGLLGVNPPMDPHTMSLETLATRSDTNPKLLSGTGGLGDLSVLRFTFSPKQGNNLKGKTFVDVSLDAKLNFLIKKVVFLREGQDPWLTLEITEFLELKPGLYFPKKSLSTQVVNGKVVAKHIATISDISINEPIDDEMFILIFQPNTMMADGINQSNYLIDEFGERISEAKIVSPIPPPGIKLNPKDEIREAQTKDDSSLSYWFILPGFGIFFICLGLWLNRKPKQTIA